MAMLRILCLRLITVCFIWRCWLTERVRWACVYSSLTFTLGEKVEKIRDDENRLYYKYFALITCFGVIKRDAKIASLTAEATKNTLWSPSSASSR
ncbi:unnamed protein product [Amoebophrya sp. A25]|nr:unnamed protein product [Amoebophrya sp. A25]|eukprot:GSA25T00004140001.1